MKSGLVLKRKPSQTEGKRTQTKANGSEKNLLLFTVLFVIFTYFVCYFLLFIVNK